MIEQKLVISTKFRTGYLQQNFKGVEIRVFAVSLQRSRGTEILASKSITDLLSTDHRLFLHNLDDLDINTSLLKILKQVES